MPLPLRLYVVSLKPKKVFDIHPLLFKHLNSRIRDCCFLLWCTVTILKIRNNSS